MKLKINELKPNPFKKQIAKGKLDEDQVKRIMSNMKELGLMGALPVFKKGSDYYLINGHHRTEAIKRQFGKTHEVEVIVHDYSEDQILRGMVIENLTQRANDFGEEVENVVIVKNHLVKNKILLGDDGLTCPQSGHAGENIQKGTKGFQPEYGSIRQIVLWLDKNTGDVIKKSKVGDLLSIEENLDEELFQRVEKASHATGEKDGETIGVKDATSLSKLKDKKEQKDMAKALLDTREQHGNRKNKNMTLYKNAPEEVKQQVRSGAIDMADIELAITSYNIRERKKNKVVVEDISKKIDNLIYALKFSIRDSEEGLKGVLKDIAILSKYVGDMKEKQKARVSGELHRFSNLLQKLGDLIGEVNQKIENE